MKAESEEVLQEEIPETTDKRRFEASGDLKPEIVPQDLYDVEPRNEWVVIRKVTREERKTEAGVVLVAGGRSSRGIVVSAPPKTGLFEGDMVVFTNFPMELEDLEELTGQKDLRLVRDEEVYAVFKKRPK